jgi:hypothetical protein
MVLQGELAGGVGRGLDLHGEPGVRAQTEDDLAVGEVVVHQGRRAPAVKALSLVRAVIVAAWVQGAMLTLAAVHRSPALQGQDLADRGREHLGQRAQLDQRIVADLVLAQDPVAELDDAAAGGSFN